MAVSVRHELIHNKVGWMIACTCSRFGTKLNCLGFIHAKVNGRRWRKGSLDSKAFQSTKSYLICLMKHSWGDKL